MLVITRQKGQSIMINDQIELTILSIRGNQIKVGITAPIDIPVYRKEIYRDIQQKLISTDKISNG